ncbi:trafficking protein Mon1-domain-containing protein [Daedaleopsis nitida]|nr:trafficking protein Mon1-domain-containing protein [Daedaleopsis nitida]
MSNTPRTPRSRTPSGVPSRSGTPVPSLSSSRLTARPAISSQPSVSSLRVYSYGSAAHSASPIASPGQPESEEASSSSSIAEGILVQDPDAEVDIISGEQGSADGLVESSAGNEESKKNLRDQLRRTLSKKESFTGMSNLHEHHDANSDSVTSMIGVIQALVSIFLDDGDKLRCINAGSTRIVFLLRPPLYYVCASSWGEPESVTRFHLEYLHLQILSVVSAEQLRRMFAQRRNFDLRRLLGGAEPFLFSLLSRLEWDLAMSTSSLHCLKLNPTLRKSIADILVPTSKIKEMLYVILFAQGRVITLVRPKKHSIHPSDLHILMNTIHSPSILNNSAAASWLPVCLPKFNSAAFVNAYVIFLPRSDAAPQTPSEEATGRLVCVSGSADFEAVRGWADTVSNVIISCLLQRLAKDGLMKSLYDAIAQGNTEYSVSSLGIPGLRHFVYKSRSHVQVTMPVFEDPYDKPNEKRRLITLYQTIFDAIHAKSGQERTLKLQYLRTSHESVMGWITQPFELYVALSPRLPKSAAVGAANAIARWIQKEEKQLFLRDAAVF